MSDPIWLSPDAGVYLTQQSTIAILDKELADLRTQAAFFDRRHTALLIAIERRMVKL